jgi:hypothetical protein
MAFSNPQMQQYPKWYYVFPPPENVPPPHTCPTVGIFQTTERKTLIYFVPVNFSIVIVPFMLRKYPSEKLKSA